MTDLSSFQVTDLFTDVLAAYYNKLVGAVLRPEFANTETITATKELSDNDCQFQFITASGANRTVELAPEATTNHLTIIYNSGATYSVVVKDDSGTTTFSTLAPDEWEIYYPLNAEGWKTKSGATYATSAEVLTGTEAAKAVSPDTLNDIVTRIPRSGMMLNGKISVTVVSNDLVLALKTAAGADPAASDPVYININGTVRTVTAATSCTLADATNWFALGGAGFATIEQDLFAYAIWDSNSSVVAVAPARIPYGRLVSDFSSTNTNEKYIGNYANYTSTDDVCVIGRFAATLSAGAGYTWTVPTFTGSNLIQHPIYETRLLSWTPQWTNLTTTSATIGARYQIKDKVLRFNIHVIWGASTSIGGAVSFTPPYAIKQVNGIGDTTNDYSSIGNVSMVDLGTALYMGSAVARENNGTIELRVINAAGTYAVWNAISSTVPHTWANTDVIDINGEYFII